MACVHKKYFRKNKGFYDANASYTLDELYNHKEAMKILIYSGAVGGIQFWGFVIGLIIFIYSSSYQGFINSINISTAIAFLPSSLGLLNLYKLKNKI